MVFSIACCGVISVAAAPAEPAGFAVPAVPANAETAIMSAATVHNMRFIQTPPSYVIRSVVVKCRLDCRVCRQLRRDTYKRMRKNFTTSEGCRQGDRKKAHKLPIVSQLRR